MFLKSKRKIKLWWHLNDGMPNFGDILNPYLARHISGKDIEWTPIRRFSLYKVNVAIGSVLGIVNRTCVVWGAGIIHRNELFGNAKFLAVRGPLSGERLVELGYPNPGVYGDPALVLPFYYSPKKKNRYRVGIIPHHVDYDFVKSKVKSENIRVINLVNPNVEEVIDEIVSCDYTVSSSLHGIIVSHAYGMPSLWVEFSKNLYGDGVKFEDYFYSVGINPYQPVDLSNYIPNEDEIIKMINDSPRASTIQGNFKEIVEKLLRVCPFK
jgi:pyruvyltransferase